MHIIWINVDSYIHKTFGIILRMSSVILLIKPIATELSK